MAAATGADHTHADFLRLIDSLHGVLTAAMDQRDRRRGIVETASGPELEWVLYERASMHDAVNAARAARGAGPLPVERIERAESSASGHSDYARKFALYCAEEALDVRSGEAP